MIKQLYRNIMNPNSKHCLPSAFFVLACVTVVMSIWVQSNRIRDNLHTVEDLAVQNIILQSEVRELQEYRIMMTDYDVEQNNALQILENMFDAHEAEQQIINNGIMSNEEIQLQIVKTIDNNEESKNGNEK